MPGGDRPTWNKVTISPPSDPDEISALVGFLEALRAKGGQRCLLAGPELEDRVELPESVYRALLQVVEALRSGLAVSVVPRTCVLTSQQAADLLGVSRPTLIKLLDRGEIPFTRAGTHRRIRLDAVLAHRAKRREEQYAALEATAGDYADPSDVQAILAELADARKAVGARRRGRTDKL